MEAQINLVEDVSPPTSFVTKKLHPPTSELLEHIDFFRIDASRQLEQTQRGEFGQFLTPEPVAKLMAGMFGPTPSVVSIVDPGAGIGSLFAAVVAELCSRPEKPKAINVTAYEIDPVLVAYLYETVKLCRKNCENTGVQFSADIRHVDFIQEAAAALSGDLFIKPLPAFTAAILNPPYRKINADSDTRHQLRSMGIETSNLYTGFMSTTIKLLAPNAEMVAITPRSFCNGTYFRGFRESFLQDMSLRRIHLFDSRQEAFRDDAVLQETVILHTVKESISPNTVTITSSASAEDEFILSRELLYTDVIHPNDPERFIRVVTDGVSQQIVTRMKRFTTMLPALGLTVSTGRVVDFRAKEYLKGDQSVGTVPLIYPVNLDGGFVVWPKETKKAQSLTHCPETECLLVANETYVLVKRFSSKEQNRRVSAAIYEGGLIGAPYVGFENHLNYYHHKGRGISSNLAKGMSLYLNSTLIDAFFRQFNGHTQVNATDLRSLTYPTISELETLGRRFQSTYPTQEEIDRIIEEEFFSMVDSSTDPIATKRRIEEATDVLTQLGLPRQQINERSALTLLALLDLNPVSSWSESTQPLRGITPIMDFMDTAYGKHYAPNTRETVRRQTVHQFLDAGLITENPDKPERPVNSPKTVYQVETSALELLRTYGTSEWNNSLETYIATIGTLKKRYAQDREMKRIPIEIEPGRTITISPGGQNILVEQIIKEFASRFTPGGKLIYIGDTDEKYAYFDTDALNTLSVELNSHGKMPDVIIYHTEKNWLILIEAVTSHGPINPKRHAELQKLFRGSTAGLVLVTTFLSRAAMVQYLPEISWETEVWVAEAPSHMIHFNGERFLGPYEQ